MQLQHHKQTIQLSDHIKNKLRQHQPTPFSLSSDELALSDNSDDDVFIDSPTPERLHRRRSSTFITFALRPASKSESVHSVRKVNMKITSSPKPPSVCQECHRRENFLRNEHERLLHVYNENRKLTEQLRSATITNHHYEEENGKLRRHLTKMNSHLREYQTNFDLLKQKFATEKPKQDVRVDQLKRIRHELHIYNEVIAAKQQDEQEEIDYYSSRKRTERQ